MEHKTHIEHKKSEIITPSSWDFGQQFDAAVERTKDRIGTYILTTLACVVFSAVLLAIIGVLVIVAVSVYTSTRDANLVSGIAVGIGILYLLAIVTMTTVSNLAITHVIISDKKPSVSETIQHILPLVPAYWWVTFISGLFMAGLFVLGIFTLGIIFLLWAIWSCFMIFVFLRLQKHGLDTLWYSKALVSQNFWPIVGRLLLINGVFMGLSLFLQSQMQEHTILLLPLIALHLVFAPFAISFYYEMFRTLEVPTEVKAPRIWIAASIIGWILMVLAAGSSFMFVKDSLPSLIKSFDTEEVYPSMDSEDGISPDQMGEFERQIEEERYGIR